MARFNPSTLYASQCFCFIQWIWIWRCTSIDSYAAKDTVNKMITTDYDGHHVAKQFVISRANYCNSLLIGLLAYQTNRIQAVLNNVVRQIFGGSWGNHVTPILRDCLHTQQRIVRQIFGGSWGNHVTPILRERLHAQQRIEFKVALLVYKALNNLASEYITSYLQTRSSNQRRSTLRSADEGVFIVTVTEFGK